MYTYPFVERQFHLDHRQPFIANPYRAFFWIGRPATLDTYMYVYGYYTHTAHINHTAVCACSPRAAATFSSFIGVSRTQTSRSPGTLPLWEGARFILLQHTEKEADSPPPRFGVSSHSKNIVLQKHLPVKTSFLLALDYLLVGSVSLLSSRGRFSGSLYVDSCYTPCNRFYRTARAA